MLKQSDILPEVTLQPHQEEIRRKALKSPQRLLLLHSLGSGKSLSGITAAEAQGQPYTAIAPASLRQNYLKEIDNFTEKTVHSHAMSYSELAQNKPVDKNHTLIFDEAQNIRNPEAKRTIKAIEESDKAKQLILLSGTPIVNRPGDLVPLIRMLTGKNFTPDSFEHRYVDKKPVYSNLINRVLDRPSGSTINVKNKDELKKLLAGHIHHYDPGKPTVPTTYEDVPVTMSREQKNLYNAIWDKVPPWVRWQLNSEMEPSGEELKKTVAFLTGPRQASLSDYPYIRDKDPYKAFKRSPKLVEAHKRIMDSLGSDERQKALVFSNFIDAGLVPLSAALKRSNIPHGTFYGGLNDKERKKLVDDYNADKLRVALLGPSGTEGLSFRGTQQVHLLDPHFGPVRGRQSVGRALRFDSHIGLPEDLKNVKVYRYISRLPLSLQARILQSIGFDQEHKTHATDDHLKNISERKEKLNQKFIDVLKEISQESHGEKKAAYVLPVALGLASALAGILTARHYRMNHTSPDYETQRNMLVGGLLGLGGTLAGQTLVGHIAEKGMTNGKKNTLDDTRRIMDASGNPKEMSVSLEPGMENAYYMPPSEFNETPEDQRYGYVRLDPKYNNPSILAHELGHASIQNKGGWLSRLNQNYLIPLSSGLSTFNNAGLAPLVGYAHGPLAGMLAGAAGGIVAGVPQLINEFQASNRAVKNLRNAGYSNEDVSKAKKQLGSAWTTYLAGNMLPGMMSGGAVGLLTKGANDTTLRDVSSASCLELTTKHQSKRADVNGDDVNNGSERVVSPKSAKEILHGGEGDNKKDDEFDKKELVKGMDHEREHTTSKKIQKEIAKDHLTEDPEYYEKLEKIEKKSVDKLIKLRSILRKFKLEADRNNYHYFLVANDPSDPLAGAEVSRVIDNPDSIIRKHIQLHKDFSINSGYQNIKWAQDNINKELPDVYIIKGNPDVDVNNKKLYDKFYNDVAQYVINKGYIVGFDDGLPYTTPPGGKFWIGHSRGADRLRFANEFGAKTLRLDDYEPEQNRIEQQRKYDELFKKLNVNKISDVPIDMRPVPGPEHYTFNDDMKKALDTLLLEKNKNQIIQEKLNQITKLAEVVGKVRQHHKTPPSPEQVMLRQAKAYSDAGDYMSKHLILRQLMQSKPEAWHIDSDQGYTVGITHESGWRYHLPKHLISDMKIGELK